jgi:long-subunit fatty acid transport protein
MVFAGIIIIHFCLLPKAEPGEFEFGLTTSISERYDDNIYLEEKEYKEDDFITSITLNPSLSYKTTSTDFTLSYNPAFEFYAENSEENEVRQNGSLNLTSNLTPRLTLSATDILAFTPGQEAAREEQFTERRRRSRSTASDVLSNDFNSTLACQIFKNTAIRGGFGYRFDDYDRSEETDTDEYSFIFGADHQLTGNDTIFGEYRYRMLRYHQPSQLTEENDTNVQSFSIGNTHRFPRELVLKLSGGVLFIDEDNEEDETGWSAQIILTKSFQTGSLAVSFDRNVSPGDGGGGATIDNTFNISVSKEFSRHWSGTFSAYYSIEESTSADEREWEDLGFIAGSQYKFSKQLTGEASCSYIRQNSKGDSGGDTDQYRGRIGINYFFRPQWSVFSSYSYYQQNALDPTDKDIENNLFEVGARITWF